MQKKIEFFMYVAFSFAALPLVWLTVNDLVYYHAYPEMLEQRDAALEFLAIMGMLQVTGIILLIALVPFFYFLVWGSKEMRFVALLLVLAWPLVFVLASSAPHADGEGLYSDALSFVLLALFPWALGTIRVYSAKTIRNKHPE